MDTRSNRIDEKKPGVPDQGKAGFFFGPAARFLTDGGWQGGLIRHRNDERWLPSRASPVRGQRP
ncbi:hypothetical protein DSCA_27620 [Desulfosarcina alkanivorans]|uniref:Uncharacterized protein n=1 Tax=Desulfosarcina alkanivorans TaxID=571177 RepID=A0A5K7YGU4_9BACT|nr:hypothetical protein DSCA_27620 [Desulfosarcina alkanivorans]